MKEHPVAIITGASKGIGRACAIGLARAGYQVVLIARTKSGLEQLAAEIVAQQTSDELPSPMVFPMDVTDQSEVEECVREVAASLGRIDILLNNAGLSIRGSLNMSTGEFEQLLKANLQAPFAFLKSVVPHMKKQQSGHIFNVASRAGKYGFPNSGGYVASKFGLVGLNESLFRELAQDGISVTAICPGWVNTDMAQVAGSPLAPDEMIQPDDIMHTLQWLLGLSPGACVREVMIECKKNHI